MSKKDADDEFGRSRVVAKVHYWVDGVGPTRGHRYVACRVITSQSGKICEDTLRVVSGLIRSGAL